MSGAKKITVVGGGAFGTALACVATRAGNDTVLFLRDENTCYEINNNHRNLQRLGDIVLPIELKATTQSIDITNREIVLFAVPAQKTRQVAKLLSRQVDKARHIIACAKGLEQQSGCFQHQILAEIFPEQSISALSGPSFATDIARGLPTALTIACGNITDAEEMAKLLSTPSFRLYSSGDIVGVEVGGALKNVLAIAVGVARGMALGASAEAALIARGFAELRRLGKAMGANKETLAGLSGLGDLVLTCSSPQSRNFSYGMALCSNASLEELPLAEGVHTARTAAAIAAGHNVEAPIISAVANVVDRKLSPREAVDDLLSRPLRSETG